MMIYARPTSESAIPITLVWADCVFPAFTADMCGGPAGVIIYISLVSQVVCVGRKLVVLQWKHSAAWTAWCPASDTDTVDGFQHLRVGDSVTQHCLYSHIRRGREHISIQCIEMTNGKTYHELPDFEGACNGL